MFFTHLALSLQKNCVMKKFRIGLLPRIIIAIVLGIGTGFVMPEVVVRLFVTFNGLFSQFLGFIIPLIIVGLVTPAIADIGKGAGKMLVATTLLAYVATVLSGFLSFGVGDVVFPHLITKNISIEQISEAHGIEPFFTVAIPEPLNIMTALVMAFTVGLGLAHLKSTALRDAFVDLKDIIVKTIQAVILPLLPLYIFGIFMNMTHSGQVVHVLSAFMKVIVVIFILHIFLLIFQFSVAGLVAKKNPFRLLRNMLPAYFTALGTSSSAATIPVTLRQTVANGVDEGVAGFVVPLLRHYTFVGQHAENRCVRAGVDDNARHSVRFSDVCRFHLYAWRDDGGRSGSSRRSDNGGAGHSVVDARLRPKRPGTYDSPVYRYGQLRHGMQRDR